MNGQMLKFTAFRVQQPIGELFVGKIPSDQLINLAKADIRRITHRELEEMSGIQRSLNPSRVASITKYIETIDASFPNTFILNLNSKFLNAQPKKIKAEGTDGTDTYLFEVFMNERVFSIIDGQHRLSGFRSASVEKFDLIVAFFVDLRIEDQAYLFSTINMTQQKVNKSLVYDLFDVSDMRSPQRTAHLVTKALNMDKDSPLYKKIKLLGIAPKFKDEILYKASLSQGIVADRIVKYISNDPMKDRDEIRRGNKIDTDITQNNESLIFRNFFAEDKDWAILRIMKNYFQAVKEAFPDLWEGLDNPLPKTIGYAALMRLLVDIFKEGRKKGDLSFDFLSEIMMEIKNNRDNDPDNVSLTFEYFPASGAGETKLYKQLKKWADLPNI